MKMDMTDIYLPSRRISLKAPKERDYLSQESRPHRSASVSDGKREGLPADEEGIERCSGGA